MKNRVIKYLVSILILGFLSGGLYAREQICPRITRYFAMV